METVGAWLAEHLPSSGPATIVHGDYRLGNTMFALDAPARLTAVLDWEMATIGDPLADIGYLCMMWSQAGDPADGLRAALGNVTRAKGFYTREELMARYEERSGRSVGDVRDDSGVINSQNRSEWIVTLVCQPSARWNKTVRL